MPASRLLTLFVSSTEIMKDVIGGSIADDSAGKAFAP